MEEGTQTALFDVLDQLINEGDERRISQAKARLERDGYRIMMMHEIKELPLGTVIIIEQPRWRDNRQVMHYYRTVLGEHMTVGGPVRHLEAAVNDEWNDLPPWMMTGNRQAWTYPNSTHVHWTKGEMEEDEEE